MRGVIAIPGIAAGDTVDVTKMWVSLHSDSYFDSCFANLRIKKVCADESGELLGTSGIFSAETVSKVRGKEGDRGTYPIWCCVLCAVYGVRCTVCCVLLLIRTNTGLTLLLLPSSRRGATTTLSSRTSPARRTARR